MSTEGANGESGVDEQYECPTCRRSFSTRQGLGQHHSHAHGEKFRIEVQCSDCGASLERKPHRAEQQSLFFCDRECESAYKAENQRGEDNPFWSEKVDLVCEWCGDDYTRIPSAADGSRFCSRDCQTDWQAEDRRKTPLPEGEPGNECPVCGDLFYTNKGMQTHRGMKHGRITTYCNHCGDEVKATQHELDSRENHYCSTECSRKHLSETRSGEKSVRWVGRIKVDCTYCGAPAEIRPNEIGKSGHWFCDNRCYGDWRAETFVGEDHHQYTPLVGKECEWCSAQFEVKEHQVDARFCSRECVNQWKTTLTGENSPSWSNRIKVECEQCGEQFKVIPSREETARFCSYSCRHKWARQTDENEGENHPLWKGGYVPYGPGWNDAKKELIRERDGRKCRICGKSEAKHIREHERKHTVHHIVKARSLRDAPAEVRNAPFNLVSMCRDHHIGEWEEMPPLLQFMAFLPHPPLPTEQATLLAFVAADD